MFKGNILTEYVLQIKRNTIDLNYLGSIKLPILAGPDRFTWQWAGGPIAYDSQQNKIYMQGHINFDDIGEFALPDVGQIAPSPVWKDWTNGRLASLRTELKAFTPNGIRHRGLVFADNALYGNVQPFYNVTNYWMKGHWCNDMATDSFYGFGKISLKNLEWGGFLGVLPQSVQDALNFDSWMFESVPQGLSATNQGPALALFNRSKNIVDDGEVKITPLFDSYQTHAYPGWWGDRQINGATFTNTHFVCTYRNSFGTRWYGNGSNGRVMGEASTDPLHQIQSTLFPGKVAIDPYDNVSQGYHAEQYKLYLLCASIESIIAGTPIWEEIDISQNMIRSIRGQGSIVFDSANSRLIISEWSADGSIPRLHVFQTTKLISDKERISQLETSVSELQSEIDAKNQEISDIKTTISQAISQLQTTL